jgi:phosphate transport system permease protein
MIHRHLPTDSTPAKLGRPRLTPRRLLHGDFAPPLVLSFLALIVVFEVGGISPSSAIFGFLVSWLVLFTLTYAFVIRRRHGRLIMKDRLAQLAVGIGGLAAFAPLAAILYSVFSQGLPVAFAKFPHFFVVDLSQAGPEDPVTDAGVFHAIVGTAEQVGLATLITVPIAILTALYLSEATRSRATSGGRGTQLFASLLRAVIDAMNGIPSIIAALFVYLIWVQPRGTHGYSGAAAAVAFSILMVPTTTRTAEEVLQIVPGSLREAALALGAPEWRVALSIVLPTARTGLVSGVILGVARAVGETAPALFTAFGTTRTNLSPFNGPQSNLGLTIYNLIYSPAKNSVREAWGGAVVLFLLVGILFATARLLSSSSPQRRYDRRRRLLLMLHSSPRPPLGES